jgi:pSer/pThr/pTyr-binding forkhead associated (FHA) protein
VKELGAVTALLATQNLDAVLRVMQWGVIALIFLFFLRVVRAVWVEMSPATVRKSRSEKRQERAAARPPREASSRRKPLYLRVTEPPERAGQTFDLEDELTIGRSPGCGVSTPEDIYASTLHARLFKRSDQLWVEDLGSTNGTYVNAEKISQAMRLGRGDVLQVGSTVLEVAR